MIYEVNIVKKDPGYPPLNRRLQCLTSLSSLCVVPYYARYVRISQKEPLVSRIPISHLHVVLTRPYGNRKLTSKIKTVTK